MGNIKAFLDAPNLGPLEKEYILRAVDSTYVSTVGPFVPEFEEKFTKYVGAKKAVSVQSGTAALHLALYELGIGKGDEVIVPALSFIASVNVVLYVGATPIIVDVNPETWNIEPEEIEKAITPHTKAIIPVHLYGNPCDIDTIMNIAKEHNLYVIEDATESLGATYEGKQTGTFGDFGCFSFNGNKLITTGGGGMIVTNYIDKAQHIKFLVNQARDASRGYYHPEMGFNYRMTNLEAALGLAQLARIDEFVEKKRKFREIYKKELGDIPYIKFQEEYDKARGSWWLNCVKFEKDINIDYLIQQLKEKGVETRRVFMPLSEMPYLKKYSKSVSNTYDIYKNGICLPSSTLNDEDAIAYAISAIRKILNG
jgi:perosamine synthetase